jgi:phosphotriesterase-related protein
VTLGHEHLRFRDEAVAANWPGRYDDDAEFAAAVAMVNLARSHGVQTIVDPTPMNAGRDVRFMARVADTTGVRVVACTGIYSFDHLPFYFENRDVDTIAEHFVGDIEQGVQGTPIRAAFLKTTADLPGITERVEKIHRAAARASVQTGAPIMSHSCPAVGNGLRQVAIFEEEGVDLSRVQISHYGDTTDIAEIEALLAAGVYVGLDRFGSPAAPFTLERTNTLAALVQRGHIDRLIVSHDHCGFIDWFPPEVLAEMFADGNSEGLGVGLIFERVLPMLREQGVLDESRFEAIFVDNPRRWLTGS